MEWRGKPPLTQAKASPANHRTVSTLDEPSTPDSEPSLKVEKQCRHPEAPSTAAGC